MVYTGPVNIGAPPVGAVYQLKVALGVLDDAMNVAVCPAFTAWVGGVTATSGPLLPLPPLTVTVPVARVGDVAPVVGSLASA